MIKKKILVVDDQEINRRILAKILGTDYEVLMAENGEVAMDILNREKSTISGVLLDIIMPVMSGYEVLTQMHEDAELSKIPVLVASQSVGDGSELKALNLGAGDFVAKPYDADILKKRLSNLIEICEAKETINLIKRDILTGLLTKEAFCHELEGVILEYQETDFDIVSIDAENFKLINDTYGTAEGDELLKFIATKIREMNMPRVILAARSYADCFYVLVERTSDYIEQMVDYFRESLEEYPLNIGVHLKYGIYEITDRLVAPNAMCDRAVIAVRTVKGKYETTYAYYDDAFRERLLLHQQITDTMEEALAQEQFVVYFQPKYEVNGEKLCGAEALVRWIHPKKGFMPPSEFISVFENNGFITNLDKFVWEKTCKFLSEWKKQGKPYVPVSVNVSRRDIAKMDLTAYFRGLIHKYGLIPEDLHLEITETAYTDDPEQMIEEVTKLRDAGFVIEMDDFGSGYSSLNMLARLPIDILKLDMKFMQSNQLGNQRKILNFIVGMAEWMDLSVIAEGVETEEQLKMLQEIGCNYVQGYYFAKPMPEDEYRALLFKSEVAPFSPNRSLRRTDVG